MLRPRCVVRNRSQRTGDWTSHVDRPHTGPASDCVLVAGTTIVTPFVRAGALVVRPSAFRSALSRAGVLTFWPCFSLGVRRQLHAVIDDRTIVSQPNDEGAAIEAFAHAGKRCDFDLAVVSLTNGRDVAHPPWIDWSVNHHVDDALTGWYLIRQRAASCGIRSVIGDHRDTLRRLFH